MTDTSRVVKKRVMCSDHSEDGMSASVLNDRRHPTRWIPPLDAPVRLLRQASRLYDEGATDFVRVVGVALGEIGSLVRVAVYAEELAIGEAARIAGVGDDELAVAFAVAAADAERGQAIAFVVFLGEDLACAAFAEEVFALGATRGLDLRETDDGSGDVDRAHPVRHDRAAELSAG